MFGFYWNCLKSDCLTSLGGFEYFFTEIKQENIFYAKPRGSQQKVKLNPINKHGQVSRCAIFDSKIHWAKQCPRHLKN